MLDIFSQLIKSWASSLVKKSLVKKKLSQKSQTKSRDGVWRQMALELFSRKHSMMKGDNFCLLMIFCTSIS